MKKSERILREYPIMKAIILLGAPSILAMLVLSLNNIIDKFYLGRIGVEAVAANNFYFSIALFFMTATNIIISGGSAYIAKALGGDDYKKANQILSTSILLSCLLAVLISIVSVTFINDFAKVLNVSETVLPSFREYSIPMFSFYILFILVQGLSDLFKGQGHAIISFVGISLALIGNIIITPILIFQLDMGVAGAAYGTVLSHLGSTILLLFFLFTGKITSSFSLKSINLRLEFLKKLINGGLPGFVGALGFSIVIIYGNNVASSYGDAAVAAFGIMGTLVVTFLFFIWGSGGTAIAIGGYAFSRGNMLRLKNTFIITVIINLAIFFPAALSYIFLGDEIVQFFINDPDVIAIGGTAISLYGLLLFIIPIPELYISFTIAIGKGQEGALLLGATAVYFLIGLLFLPVFWGGLGVCLTYVFADVLFIITAFILIYSSKDFRQIFFSKTTAAIETVNKIDTVDKSS